MSVSFDKKLAELDAYLQMLISENDNLDQKLANLARSSQATINSYESEIEGVEDIRNNLKKLIGSIKHSIVLLQIARVSARCSISLDSLSLLQHDRAAAVAATGAEAATQQAVARKGGAEALPQPPFPLPSPSAAPPKKSVGGPACSNNNDGNETAPTSLTGAQPGLDPATSATLTIKSPLANTITANTSATEEEEDDDAFFDANDESHKQQDQQQQQQQQQLQHQHLQQQPDRQKPFEPSPRLLDTRGQTDRLAPLASSPSQGSERETVLLDSSSGLVQQAPNPSTMSETNNNVDSTSNDGSIDWDALYEEEDEEELTSMESQGSVIKHLLSQIRIGMDLTKVVLPTFILERRSLLEMYADFFAHPDLFSAIPDFSTPEERMIQLVRWYLSAFHAGRKSSLAKKPYNPILGEIFRCNWYLQSDTRHQGGARETASDKGNATTTTTTIDNNDANDKKQQQQLQQEQNLTFVAEQVSHHPPVSAFYAENKEKNISCCAHIYTKSKYLGLSVGVHNIGQGVITLEQHKETYTCTFPSAYGRSILTVPWVELGGPVTIACKENGYTANIEFVMKPFYGGKKHRVTGEILRPNNEPLLNIEGEWNGIMYSRSPNSGEKKIFVDTTSLPVIRKHVKPVTAQESFESRNVWKEVTRALKLKDVNSATAAKSYIEQRQRDSLKDRQEQGVEWKTRYFELASGDAWRYAGRAASD